jgi:hypothetical protein
MKKLIYILVIFFSVDLSAQVNYSDFITSGEATSYKKQAVRERPVIAYPYLREADVKFSRRVIRCIDSRQKMNKQLEWPKQGYGALMEYLQQVATAPKGLGSLSAGAYGAQKVNELQKQRESDIFDLTMKKLDLGFKNEEAQRSFKLDTLKTGRDVFDKVKDNSFKALQEQGQNDRQASANATSMANAAMQASVSAQGHKLQAEMQLRNMLLAEKRGDRDNTALQLKALSETAKDMGTLLKAPGYIQTPDGQAMLADYKGYLAAIAKFGGVTQAPSLGGTTMTGAPSNTVRAPLK